MPPKLIIKFLGTGISQGVPIICCNCPICLSKDPRDKRLRASIYIESPLTKLVIDTGPDFRQQMLREKIQDLDAILITHSHRDHIGGIDEIRPFCYFYKKTMPIYGSQASLEEIKRSIPYAFGENRYPGAPDIDLREIASGESFKLRDLEILSLEVDHIFMPVNAYRFGNFAYVTDAKYIPVKSMEALKGLDTLILNCLRQNPHPSHLCLDEALAIIEELKPKRCYLTHIGHDLGLYKEVAEKLGPNIYLAYDGLMIRVD